MMMMIMVAPNSFTRKREGVQKEGEEEMGDHRKGSQTGISTSGANAPTGLSRSEVLDARNKKKHGRWYGVPFHRKGRGG